MSWKCSILVIFSFIDSFIQQTFIKHVLCINKVLHLGFIKNESEDVDILERVPHCLVFYLHETKS